MLKNIFYKEISSEIIFRINKLKPDSKAQWGTMTSAQMFAHCSVTYEMVYENIHKKPNAFFRLVLKLLVKNKVVSEKPYSHNLKTAPQFIIKETKDFEKEKNRLINYINKTQELGEKHFDNKESLSFGVLNKTEWNNMFFKHLDHHLRQFGV
jgi:hypothetical protein